jgi:hypothetical protein
MTGHWVECALVMLPGDVEAFDNVLRRDFAAEDIICTMAPKLAVDLPTAADDAHFLGVLPTVAADGEWLKPDSDSFYLLGHVCKG